MKPPAASTADATFEAVAAKFLEGYLASQPLRATEAGDHRFDDRWPDLSEKGDEAARSFIAETRKALGGVARDALSQKNRIDAQILENQLDLLQMSLDDLRPAVSDPVFYTTAIGDGLDPLVTRDFAPPAARAASLKGRLAGIPALIEVAKKRLKNPAQVFTETAIQQNKGLVDLCENGLGDMARAAGKDQAEVERLARAAAAALRDFQQFLEKDLLPRSDGDFRLGKARFEKKLRLVLDDRVDANALMLEALALVRQTQTEMVETARELWPTVEKGKRWVEPKTDADRRAVVKRVLDKLAEDRSDDATVVKDAEKTLTEATKFVREKDLVRLPDEPCKIIEMPEYRRGVAIAYCDAAGALEAQPQTFYAISPTPKGWTKKRVESYYREYNHSMLYDLTVHEAMPGHFLQLMHNNKFESKLRAVFSHGAFVEGWAVYTEWLMAKHGFGGPRVRMQRQKMALRMASNAVLDYGVHAGDMTEKQAMSLMMDEAFQEEGEAVGKWRRARLTSAQLTTYYYGFTQMMKLRKKAEAQPGFTERAYHDKLLSFGSPAPRYIAEILAGDGK